MNNTKRFLGLSLMVAAICAVSVVAQEGLYDPAPPANSAFVRVFNSSDAAFSATLDTKAYKGTARTATPYLVIPEGSRAFNVGKTATKFSIKAGKFYTITVDDTASLMEDMTNTNRTKTMLSLYNIGSNSAISLKTADGKTNVIESVNTNSSKSIVVNGIKIGFAVFSDGKSVSIIPETQLERGSAYSVFVSGAKDALKVSWVKSSTSVK